MLSDMSTEWVTFQEKLIEAEGMLKKHKVSHLLDTLLNTIRCDSVYKVTLQSVPGNIDNNNKDKI
mgnify:FL=1